MAIVRYSLCPNCDSCPEVVMGDQEVTIGEGQNTVKLSTDEWNVLVEAIQRGELGKPGVKTSNGREGGSGCACGSACDCC